MQNLCLKKVSEISGHFFVPSYQRGYRWGSHEVTALLDDIYACRDRPKHVKYCLQPIVIKVRATNSVDSDASVPCYELIDGQQRLTTLRILYHYLNEIKNITPRFSLTYETRPHSAEYLSNLDLDRSEKNIDFFHMHGAYNCIKAWFSSIAAETDDGEIAGVADDIYSCLRNQVHVIWYDAGNEDSISLFTRLNVGRIALTNAELVKALLLAGPDKGQPNHSQQIEISTQWDMIERELHDEEFWAFLTNKSGSSYPTRIEILFDLLAAKQDEEKDSFFTFEYFRTCLKHAEQKPGYTDKDSAASMAKRQHLVWKPVLGLYYLLREWFEDRDRYHKVGYLVAIGEDLSTLVQKALGRDPGNLGQASASENAPTKSAFLAYLDNRIRDRLNLNEDSARNLDYQKHYDACERLLLLFNVESTRLLEHSSERYPFHSHKEEQWSLEHIHAQNAEPLRTAKEWRAWLMDSVKMLESLPNLVDKTQQSNKLALLDDIGVVLNSEKEVERRIFEPLSRRIMSFVHPADSEAEEHSIANLALLSGRVNSALNNGAFPAKRLRIIDLDQQGAFIPICTKRAFFKYYTSMKDQQLYLWSQSDREAYLEAMLAPPQGQAKREGILWKYLNHKITDAMGQA